MYIRPDIVAPKRSSSGRFEKKKYSELRQGAVFTYRPFLPFPSPQLRHENGASFARCDDSIPTRAPPSVRRGFIQFPKRPIKFAIKKYSHEAPVTVVPNPVIRDHVLSQSGFLLYRCRTSPTTRPRPEDGIAAVQCPLCANTDAPFPTSDVDSFMTDTFDFFNSLDHQRALHAIADTTVAKYPNPVTGRSGPSGFDSLRRNLSALRLRGV